MGVFYLSVEFHQEGSLPTACAAGLLTNNAVCRKALARPGLLDISIGTKTFKNSRDPFD